MKLYPIHAMGIKAYCSDIIIDPREDSDIYFLSVCGYQATVKGIVANLLGNYGISIEIDGVFHYLSRTSFGYKTIVKKLPSGLVHAIAFPKASLPAGNEESQNSFFIFTRKGDDFLSLFYRHLDEKTDIPLHPSWADWIFKAFMEHDGWILELSTLSGSYTGYLFEFNPNQLHEMIKTAIQNNTPEITGCFCMKGVSHG